MVPMAPSRMSDALAQQAFEFLRSVRISAHKSIVLPWVRPAEQESNPTVYGTEPKRKGRDLQIKNQRILI